MKRSSGGLGVVVTDPDGTILYADAAGAELHGAKAEQLVGQDVSVLTPEGRRREITEEQLDRGAWEEDSLDVRSDGETFSVRLESTLIKAPDGQPAAVVTTYLDTSARSTHLGWFDPLTGLATRNALLKIIDREITRYKRHQDKVFAVLYFGLDQFSTVKSGLGPFASDDLITMVANRWKPLVRPTDTLAHVGNEEFALLVDDLRDPSDTIRVVSRLGDAMADPFIVADMEVFVHLSAGAAIHDSTYADAAELVRDADIAMHQTSVSTDAPVTIFQPSLHLAAVARIKLEADLRRGIDRGEFLNYYQPIVDIAKDRTIGFEALLRWQHPERGLLHPDEFLDVAEETGLLSDIGQMAVREACQQLARCRFDEKVTSPPIVSINLSSTQLTRTDVAANLADILRETGIDASRVWLEITETVMMHDPDASLQVLGKLCDMGFRLYVDDFGTGYSSLAYLHRFPFTGLKIDRSFVQDVHRRKEAREIVRTVIALADILNVGVVAEGIETRNQARLLLDYGCQVGQGFYFSKPFEGGDMDRHFNA